MLLPVLKPRTTLPQMETGPRSIHAVRMLRISLTDRCNFRCVYCMPSEGVQWLPSGDLLSADEIVEVAKAALEIHGITRFKLTGGEPTLRADLLPLVRRLAQLDGVEDISLTTNGMLLERLARPLLDAGLDRVTVSIDSLRPERFRRITRTGDLPTVLRGIETAERVGFGSIKINVVTMRGVNDDELADFAGLTWDRRVSVRFIEYMPLGDAAIAGATDRVVDESETGPAGGCGAQDRGSEAMISEAEARAAIERVHGPLTPVERSLEAGVGPAVMYCLSRGEPRGRIGFISAMSAPFCDTCNRLRLTATGVLRSCLFEGGEVNLSPILRDAGGAGRSRRDLLAEAMVQCVKLKPDVHSAHGNTQMSRIGG